jgi:hypothetical protein
MAGKKAREEDSRRRPSAKAIRRELAGLQTDITKARSRRDRAQARLEALEVIAAQLAANLEAAMATEASLAEDAARYEAAEASLAEDAAVAQRAGQAVPGVQVPERVP